MSVDTQQQNCRLSIFAEGDIGYRALAFIQENYPEHLQAVVLTAQSSIRQRVLELGIPESMIRYSDSLYAPESIAQLQALELDYIILAWWPYIIREPLISLPKVGVLNFHPSYLPYNRGKGYSFWTIVEDTPFGVSIHFVNAGIDAGDIVFQKRIAKTWEDTGQSLYYKAQTAMMELFEESYPAIVAQRFERKPQDPNAGTFHYARELDPASRIDLDKKYTGRELLNLLRARTFEPHPACYFYDDGVKHEVRIAIKAERNEQ